HVGGFPAELIDDLGDRLFCGLIVAADEHGGAPALELRIHHAPVTTELKALTNCALVAARWSRSIRDSSCVVKNRSTPLTGGAAAMGFVASMTGLFARFAAPAARTASTAAVPFTASATSFANLAASSKLPTRALGCCAAHSASLDASRVPIMTSWPCFKNPA